jgi:apolipoprotein N-acyltransferase
LEQLSSELNSAILTGCKHDEIFADIPVALRYNSCAFITPQLGYQGCYDKAYLVPWREFQPRVAAALGMLPKSPVDAAYAGPYCPGGPSPSFLLPHQDKRYRIGCSICFEISYSMLHRGLMARDHERPLDFFVGCANESAFPGPLYSQLSFDAQRLRAIECRRAFARVAQDGISAFVDGNGDVLSARWTGSDAEVLVCRIPVDRRTSLYVAWGDWLPLLSSLVLASLILLPGFRRFVIRET